MNNDLISRSALFKSWDGLSDEIKDPDRLIDEMIKRTQDAPTIDAVEVVRCKDCKLFKEYTELFRGSSGYDGACRILAGYTDCDREMRKYMDYCSFGERKMNAEVEG